MTPAMAAVPRTAVPRRILVAEDEKKVASFLEQGLREEGYAVDVAHDGTEASMKAMVHDYDLLLLDVMMPGKTGLEIVREVRSREKNQGNLIADALLQQARETPRGRLEQLVLARRPGGLDGGTDAAAGAGDRFVGFALQPPLELVRAVAAPDQVCVAIDEAGRQPATTAVHVRVGSHLLTVILRPGVDDAAVGDGHPRHPCARDPARGTAVRYRRREIHVVDERVGEDCHGRLPAVMLVEILVVYTTFV